MDALEAIKSRRSVREFTTQEVADGQLDSILEAGRWAPSGLNNQPWKFKVLRGVEKDALAKHTKYGQIIKNAPVCIVVFYDEAEGYDRTKDLQAIGACLQNMLLAAHALGLGAVWLGEILNQHEAVEKELGTKHELMAVIAIGRPQDKKRTSTRKKLEEIKIG